MNKIDFNQEFELLDKKYRGKGTSETKGTPVSYSIQEAIQDMYKSGLITKERSIFSFGAGKEAFVVLGEKNGSPVCVKSFRPYSATNTKRKKSNYHITNQEMAMIMARTEFQNLRILDYYNVNSPKPLEYNNGSEFSMEFITLYKNETEGAPLVKDIRLDKTLGIDPADFLDALLDEIYKMFSDAFMVHGDLSEFNILVTQNNGNFVPVIIDVSQSRLYNHKTFTSTPVRIRIDKALKILERDIKITLNHFEQKYKIFYDHKDVFDKLYDKLPDFAKKYSLVEQQNMIKQRLPREFYIDANEVNSQTTLKRRSKETKLHKKIQDSLNYY